MSDVLHLRASDARVLPWKNGRGFTRELALWPAGASFERADFDWRISRAAVEEDGPFSSFPGFERVLVITEGAGLALDHGALAPQVQLARLVPYRFSGDWPTSAKLVAGRVADFNVICRRGAVHAEVQVLDGRIELHTRAAQAEHLFLHVLSGRLDARSESPARHWSLAAGESLWHQASNGRDLSARGSGEVLLIRVPQSS